MRPAPVLSIAAALTLGPLAACGTPEDDDVGDDDTYVPPDGDTTPPTIEHSPAAEGAEGVAIALSATVADDTAVSVVGVSYRRSGEASFTTAVLASTGAGVYSGEIPAADVTPWGVEYYIVAADTAANNATWPPGAPAEFVALEVTPNPPEVVYNLAANYDPTVPGAVVSWYHPAEEDFSAYDVFRSADETVDASDDLVGTVQDGAEQSFLDASAPAGDYSWYRVRIRDIWEGEAWSDVARLHGLYLYQESRDGFDQPSGLLVTIDGGLHVCDRGSGEVSHYDVDGNPAGETDSGLSGPIAIAQGQDTGFYVAESGADRIAVFGGTGEWGDAIDEATMTPASWKEALDLAGPTGLSFTTQFQPVLVDSGNGRVIRLTDDFVYFAEVGDAGGAPLVLPWAGVVHPGGLVVVSDTGRSMLAVYEDSNLLPEQATWATAGSGDGQLDQPLGLAVDAFGSVLVADSGNQRVARFSDTGVWQGSFGSDHLMTPTAVAVAPDGAVYVADEGLGAVVVFGP